MKNILLIMLILISYSIKAQYSYSTSTMFYYDYEPDIILQDPIKDTLRIDINNDKILDIQMYSHYYPATNFYFKTLNKNCLITFFLKTNLNDTLSSKNLNWLSGDWLWISYDYQNKLGVKLIEGDSSYYGWVSFKYTNPPQLMTIYDYAFCKIPNYPLVFGQKEIKTGISEDKKEELTIKILNENLHIQTKKKIQQVYLYAINGEIVYKSNSLANNEKKVALQAFPHGSYILQVEFEDSTKASTKIVW